MKKFCVLSLVSSFTLDVIIVFQQFEKTMQEKCRMKPQKNDVRNAYRPAGNYKICVDMTLCLNTVLRVAKMDISRKMFKKGGAQFGI